MFADVAIVKGQTVVQIEPRIGLFRQGIKADFAARGLRHLIIGGRVDRASNSRPGAQQSRNQTKREVSTAARTKSANNGCGAKGLDLSSGWNCTPMNQG